MSDTAKPTATSHTSSTTTSAKSTATKFGTCKASVPSTCEAVSRHLTSPKCIANPPTNLRRLSIVLEPQILKHLPHYQANSHPNPLRSLLQQHSGAHQRLCQPQRPEHGRQSWRGRGRGSRRHSSARSARLP